MAKKPTSIRDLAGTGKQLDPIDDPILEANVRKVLDSTPHRIAEIALGSASLLQTALAYLVDKTVLNTNQYDLIAREIIAIKPEKRPEAGLVSIIVQRVSTNTVKNVRDVLGWNDIGADGSFSMLG